MKITAIDKKTGERTEINDLYWFEKKGVHDFDGYGFYDEFDFEFDVENALPVMTKYEAQKWAREKCERGTGVIRQQFYDKFGAGKVAEALWNNPTFTLGIEYGLLIAVAFVFGDLVDDEK